MLSTAPGTLADVPVILLDLDGTLVDSGPGILASLTHAFAACDEQVPEPAVLRSFLGPPLTSSFRDTLGLSAERAEQLRLAYVAHYRDHGLQETPPYPGIPELLSALAASGRTVAVATNKLETTAQHVLEHQGLAEHFAVIGGTDRAAGRSDKAAVIGSVLERLGVAPGASSADGAGIVMVGDRIHDAEGAAEHGVPALLAGWGYLGPLEQRAEFPRVETVAELRSLLLG